MSTVSFLLFSAFSVIWVTSLWFDVQHQPRLGHHWYIYKLVMLTNLNFVLDVFYSVLVILGYRFTKLKSIADFMHFTSVFPVGIVTCGLFWILYAIDPALVMPDWIAKLIPAWLNHITHTFPVFYIFLDSYFHKRKSPGNKSCWIISAILVFIYFTIIGYVRYYDGYWLYPILTMFAIEHFVISYILAFFGFFLLIKAACLLNNKLHDQTNSKSSAKIGKVKKIH